MNTHVVIGLSMPNRGTSPKHKVSYDLSTSRSELSRMDFGKGKNFFLQPTVFEGLQTTLQQFVIFLHFTRH